MRALTADVQYHSSRGGNGFSEVARGRKHRAGEGDVITVQTCEFVPTRVAAGNCYYVILRQQKRLPQTRALKISRRPLLEALACLVLLSLHGKGKVVPALN
jgi:hypothetical protein